MKGKKGGGEGGIATEPVSFHNDIIALGKRKPRQQARLQEWSLTASRVPLAVVSDVMYFCLALLPPGEPFFFLSLSLATATMIAGT